jgi:hypothetical protein
LDWSTLSYSEQKLTELNRVVYNEYQFPTCAIMYNATDDLLSIAITRGFKNNGMEFVKVVEPSPIREQASNQLLPMERQEQGLGFSQMVIFSFMFFKDKLFL